MCDIIRPIPPGTAAPRNPLPGRDLLLLAVGVLICAAAWAVFAAVQGLRPDLATNRDVGYANRAAICDMQKGIGLVESASCADPLVARYRDPNVKAGSTASARTSKDTQRLLCALLDVQRAQGRQVPVTTLCGQVDR